VVVLGAVGMPAGPGNAANLFRGYDGQANASLLKNPTGLAVDPIGQRLFLADSANPAIRVMDMGTGDISLALGRPGYYGHNLSPDDVGPVGLALATASIPGFRVVHRVHTNYEGVQRYGKYFYFNASNISGSISGVHEVRQYRSGNLLWIGLVQFYSHTLNLGPFAQACGPACTAQGVRYPEGNEQFAIPGAAEEDQWELGDVVLVVGLHANASQPLYMAEGHNFVVRMADIGSPVTPVCTSLTGSVARLNAE